MLPPLECENQEKPQEFARRAQHALADDLGVKHSDISKEDVEKWLAGEWDISQPTHCIDQSS